MRNISTLLLVVCFAAVCSAYDNNPPIPALHPGFAFTGAHYNGFDLEVFFDILCSDCKANNPIFQDFLNSAYQNSTVRDYIRVNYALIPLPYHHESWIVTKLAPYFIAQCHADAAKCQYYNYIDYTLKNQDDVLLATDSTQDSLIQSWTQQVATALNVTQQDLLDVYDENQDKYNSEMTARYMWKYATSRGVSGTPTAVVNGVVIQDWPGSADAWLQLLKDVTGVTQ